MLERWNSHPLEFTPRGNLTLGVNFDGWTGNLVVKK